MRNRSLRLLLLSLLFGPGALLTSRAGDLAFSDPANVPPPPSWAVGQADRRADLDVLPGFKQPPPGFGIVPFYWWLGDPLTKERIGWQLDQLARWKGVSGLQVNYAHSDRGGRSWGLTYPSDPPLFSEDWWKLYGWFMQAVKQRGLGGVSLSDYTLGFGQGWYVDELLREYPDACGSRIGLGDGPQAEGGREVRWTMPPSAIGCTAYRLDGDKPAPGSGVDLRPFIKNRELQWTPPEGRWTIKVIHRHVEKLSLDPLHPLAGRRYIEKFFQRFENRFPGEGGKGLNFFFSDELGFGVNGTLWTDRFAAEFQKRKGYDVVPELPALYLDVGPRTAKVRLDYYDVLVALEEDSFFKPLFDWHQQRGMIFGCDHGGRGLDVTEFGDYFRTQRWNQGPGSDQPGLAANVTKAKVASSMAHLYLRPRVWLEGYYGSGWGTTSEQLTDATFKNFVAGYNLLSTHGLYYSLHGGWWEWAPPCNLFRMPYWEHMGRFLDCVQRLSYLLSQGHHRCDVAVLYPVAPLEAGLGGHEAVNAAFGTGELLYGNGMDYDFMDFESLARATVTNRQLRVSGEEYRALVLPAMRAVRYSTLQKAAEFFRAGGVVIAAGALPEASDRAGREDAELDGLVKSVFGVTAREAAGGGEPLQNTNAAGGRAVVARNPDQVRAAIQAAFPRDFSSAGPAPRVQHRQIGSRDIYALYGAGRGTECAFRATGRVELWDPWTGATRPLSVVSQQDGCTKLKLPLDSREIQVIVFSPGAPAVGAAAEPAPQVLPVQGPWAFELKPTLDNQWGDFRWPPFKDLIGAEMRQIKYADETQPDPGWQDPKFDDRAWRRVTYSYGPKFWKLGPLPEQGDRMALEAQLAGLKQIDPATLVEFEGRKYTWQPCDFSWRFGLERDIGRQGYHGLKELVHDEFLTGIGRCYLWTAVTSARGAEARVVAGGVRPAKLWLNHAATNPAAAAKLAPGANPLLLRYDQDGRGYLVFDTEKENSPLAAKADTDETPNAKVKPLAMSWWGKPGVLAFDTRPGEPRPAGWFRFLSPPGLKEMTLTARGTARVWVDGKECRVKKSRDRRPGDLTEQAAVYTVKVDRPALGPVCVALRVEQARGCYGGATLPEPIRLDCGTGEIALGDWSKLESLASYSGGAWYRKALELTKEQAGGRVVLNLGDVAASAEVQVNGRPAGIRLAPPWTFDLTGLVRPGENRVAVLVYSALANHYSTIPTNYRGSPQAGLLGPVSLELSGAPAPATR